MAKTKISEYDATASNNTDINSVNIAEGCAPSGINNAIRETMAALKRFQTGADGDPLTVGNNLVVSGNSTLGDASGDSVTINAATVSTPNGLNFDSNTFVIDATNNRVGIGTITPIDNLDVAGGITISSADALEITGSDSTTSQGVLNFYRGGAGDKTGNACSIRTVGDGANNAAQLVFNTNGTEAIRIDANGNVGINASVPAARLEIAAGNGGVTDPLLANTRLRFSDVDTTKANNQVTGGIEWYTADTDAAGVYAYISSATNSAGSGYVTFATGSSSTIAERMRITSDGYLRMASGSGGIQFGGDTASANALDDYEEGTWTPVYQPTTGAFTSVTYDALTSGRYTKIGNTVYIQGTIRTDAITIGTASGVIRLGGLPFTSASDNPSSSFTIGYSAVFASNVPSGINISLNSTSGAFYYKTAANGDSSSLNVTDLGTGANANYIVFAGFYMVA